ncbi:outer spore coat protein CotE [Brockia lithotrophica]|uniref:Spore coat protein E n=1 Tax=Brockia lithotrophica TaxID=933949 RepID=A0A660L3C1_9BACL|nr:outer spore coat protein CotE [Brockia lithotrophica]RKQ88396.1 spore coat protein E [Brockia lithotrophica]
MESLEGKRILFREILTKAVVGRGRKYVQNSHRITPEHTPTGVLGLWVIGHVFSGRRVDDAVEVEGSYEVNAWYAYDNNTKTDVAKATLTYRARIPLGYLDPDRVEDLLMVRVSQLEAPHAVEARVVDGEIAMTVAMELEAELVGETRLCVVVAPDACAFPGEKEKKDPVEDDLFADELD